MVLFISAGLAFVSTGCAARSLTITQDDRINNAMHMHRPPAQRTGDPLEVTIACVYPDDLKRAENQGLKPKSGITCKDWYDHQPLRAGGEGGHFNLPSDQIYLLTNETQLYGKKKGPALQGAIVDKTAEKKVTGIQFKSTKLHSRDSVIYVFPKFIGKDGKVLPVKAGEFSPPGAYTAKLKVKIGVEEGKGVEGQYVEATMQRRLHGSEKKE
jgi:hypothetical protein